ncbi:ABC transporter ATP-binding protein [Paenilisteria rocourtiae]|uniref:Putative ABC transport system ATP-binding protein n=1 Tax=Listeria rocourtiae TaxID=647910 RepID=A0A4R6ZNE6_9LIST|nr:ABC transporter ATP-binding protein [Listeria rocourtiae]EUJ51133.1 ABC transporter [Listeria rocourtiae FSL F6-920]MBC1434138.1 ABC transporter ATP-binding protein [Listeria rocourtiae]MBC1603663.1 ABC transporter ATP-binding protein [Listeria rocourtiae]TDR54021.1 putative ABC transport system ATP-binding protein [Listeria rocourtiae]
MITVQNLQKSYNSQLILRNLSFQVKTGEFIAIMGPSGSGKTTLLNTMSTLDTFNAGKVLIDGSDITVMKQAERRLLRRDKIAFIFQHYNLLDTFTVKENIYLPFTLAGKVTPELDERFQKLAEKLKIAPLIDKFPAELSGGEKQRIAATRAFLGNPKVLFADEPTGALDTRSATAMLEILAELNQVMGTTLLMVTHDGRAASFANRVIFMVDGVIVNEFYRGDKQQSDFFDEIAEVSHRLGAIESAGIS